MHVQQGFFWVRMRVFPPSRRAIASLRRDGGWRFGDGGEPTKSARGLAQSKTLPRNPQVHGPNTRQNAGSTLRSSADETWAARCWRIDDLPLTGFSSSCPPNNIENFCPERVGSFVVWVKFGQITENQKRKNHYENKVHACLCNVGAGRVDVAAWRGI